MAYNLFDNYVSFCIIVNHYYPYCFNIVSDYTNSQNCSHYNDPNWQHIEYNRKCTYYELDVRRDSYLSYMKAQYVIIASRIY